MILSSAAIFVLIFGHCYGSAEKDVLDKILKDYDNRVRPVRNYTSQMVVQVQLQILSLLEVNSKQEYIKLALYFRMQWSDEFLKWDPSNFDGVKYIRIPASLVWKPDFSIVTTSLQPDDFIPKEDQVLGVRYTGEVDYTFPFVHTNNCVMRNDDFPFDQQECDITVTSWKYPVHLISMEHKWQNNTKPRNLNTEWEIWPFTNTTVDFRRELEPNDEDGVFRNIKYHLTLKRKSTYYVWVIIIPTFIISAVSIAGIFAPFSNDGLRQEKITLGLTTLLTLTIILSLVTDNMPKGTHLPVLGVFIFVALLLNTLSMAVSAILMVVHQRATTRAWRMPEWMKKSSLCLKDPFTKKDLARKKNVCSTVGKLPLLFMGGAVNNNDNSQAKRDLKAESNDQIGELKSTLLLVRHTLQQMEEDENREREWLVVLDHLDMLFFVVFQTINAVNFLIMLF